MFQLPHHEIGAVAPQVFFARRILSGQQSLAGGVGFQQRPIGEFSVFVAIAKQELTQGGDVRVLQLRNGGLALLFPVDLRLANAIGETKWFISIEIAGPEPNHVLECVTPTVTLSRLDKRIELVRFAKEHYHSMRFASVAAPSPV